MSTKVTSVAIQNSSVDSTSIGATTPATGRFTTPDSADNSQNAATTAWSLLGFEASLASPGYIKFPSWMKGIIVQWGQTITFDTGPISQSLPRTWPVAGFVAIACDGTLNGRIYTASISGPSSVTIHNNGSSFGNWIAIGH